MKVPLLDLKAQYATIKDEIREAVDRVLEGQQFILGPEVAALEKAVADYVGALHGIGMSSGTDALLAALMALDVGPGDQVITPPYTFFATAGAIARLHAMPVFVDIDPASYNLSPAALEQVGPVSTAVSSSGEGHHARPPLRPVRRHGTHPRSGRPRQGPGHRGRRPGHRHGVQGVARPAPWAPTAASLLPLEEPRRGRRRRDGRHQRRRPGRAPAAAAQPRRASRSTTTRSSAATSASTPSRRPSCW